MQNIIYKIIEKASFLIKMQVPSAYKLHEKKTGTLIFIKDQIDQNEPEHDWKDRLKQWKQMQTSKGAIKSFTDRKQEIYDSSVMSVLACLQTPINAQKLQKKVETTFIQATRRVAGLEIMQKAFAINLPFQQQEDLINWFCSALRKQKNNLSHYLDDISGCGNHLEEGAGSRFFKILNFIVENMKQSEEKKEIITYLAALKWKFSARDHSYLKNIQLFRSLHQGNKKKDNLLKKAWGRVIHQKIYSEQFSQPLPKEVMENFEQFFLSIVGRIIKPDTGTQMKVKNQKSAPTLEKAQSVVDTNVSDHLISEAFEVIFHEFERYIKILGEFKGVDWSIYVRARNQMRKKGENFELEDLPLFDEEEEEKKEEDEKKDEEKKEGEEEKKDGEENKEENKEEEEKEEEKKDDEEGEKEQKEEDKKEGEDGESKKDGDEEGEEEGEDEEEDQEEKDKNEAIERQDERAKAELQKISKLYSETFLKRLVRLVEIFTSISTVSAHPMSMV